MPKKQTEIPGAERTDAIPELDEAVSELVKYERTLKRAKGQLEDARATVTALLLDRARKKYVSYDGDTKRTVTLELGKAKLKVVEEDE